MSSQGVTIAIPNWNHELLLPRSIDTALRAVQVLRNHDVPAEILVVDDHSRDGSLTLLRQLEALYFDAGLHVLALRENGGVAVARNHALANASYDTMVFMDADNEIVAENIFHFYRSIRQTKAAAVYGNLIVKGRPDCDPSLVSNQSYQPRIFNGNYIDTFAMIDRAQALDAGGYNTDKRIRGCGDWELYLTLGAQGRKVVFVPLVFGIYYTLPGSLLTEASKPDSVEIPLLLRIFNQLGVRDRFLLNTRHLRYHPDLGYI
jgi:glycosyltransferase involved in cell wall biosynthesis